MQLIRQASRDLETTYKCCLRTQTNQPTTGLLFQSLAGGQFEEKVHPNNHQTIQNIVPSIHQMIKQIQKKYF